MFPLKWSLDGSSADCFISLGVIKVAAAQRALQHCSVLQEVGIWFDTEWATEIIYYFW